MKFADAIFKAPNTWEIGIHMEVIAGAEAQSGGDEAGEDGNRVEIWEKN